MSIRRTTIQTMPLPQIPGWEARVMLLELPPSFAVPAHTHPVSGVVYVLQGTVLTQFEDQEAEKYCTGQSFIEHGEMLHARVENESKTEDLKLLVSYVIKAGETYTVMKE